MFKDVKYSDWFKETIDKASSNGIVMGYTDGSFKPNNPMTRAEMASILTEFNGWDGSLIENNIENFPDVNDSPKKAVNRAGVAQILRDFIEAYLK